MLRPELHKRIDACRHEADLQLPEMADLAEQIATDPAVRETWEQYRRWDRSMQKSLRDVPVPEGLERRLLARLAGDPWAGQPKTDAGATDAGATDAGANDAGANDAGANDAGANDLPLASVLGRATSAQSLGRTPDVEATEAAELAPACELRRPVASPWKFWGATFSGAAAILFLVVSLWPSTEPRLDTEEAARQQAFAWIESLDDAHWQTADFPEAVVWPRQLRVGPKRWQPVTGTSGVVCYDLATAGQRALLFVAHTQHHDRLGVVPPANAYPDRLSWAIWKQGSTVYVLALDGGNLQYQRLIDRSPRYAIRTLALQRRATETI